MGDTDTGSRESATHALDRFISRVGPIRSLTVCLIILAGCAAVSVIVAHDCGTVFCDDTAAEISGVAQATFLITMALAIVAAFVLRGEGERRVSEGRERVWEAERDLERALGVVHGDVHFVPDTEAQEREGDTGKAAAPRRDNSALPLQELWAVTHRRLDLYHEIATGQASRSFRNAQFAMVIGFILLVAFVIVALQASTTAGAVVAGGLGAVAAALAGYVSRTFVRSQEAAAGHLRAYFDQPLEFSRYLAAERLLANSNLSDEQRAEVVTVMAQAMISGPAAPPLVDMNGSSNGRSAGPV